MQDSASFFCTYYNAIPLISSGIIAHISGLHLDETFNPKLYVRVYI